MWAWYFILTILILMAVIQVASKGGKKTFSGLKDQLPQFQTEVGEELSPQAKQKTESPIEKLSGQSIPYFETILSITEQSPQTFMAEWSVGKNIKNELSEKYGEDFLLNNQGVIRLYHLNATPQPYTQDISVELNKGHAVFHLYSPGEIINGQLGVLTANGVLIPLAQSNDIKIPQEN